MSILLKSIFNRLLQSPTKSIISLISITLGSMLITVCLNVNFKLLNMINNNNKNQVINVLSGLKHSKWSIDWDGLELYTEDVIQSINDIPEVEVISLLSNREVGFNYDGDKYVTSKATMSSNNILDVLNLEIIQGSRFSGEFERDVLISSEMADKLFRNQDVIGKKIQYMEDKWDEVTEGNWEITGQNLVDYTVTGVYKSPNMYNKTKTGSPEMIYRVYDDHKWGTLAIKVNTKNIDATLKNIESTILSVLDEERNIVVWKGNTNYYDSLHNENLGQTINMFLVFFTLLAGVSLLIASFSIFSITMISVVERSREIGLKRALGCNRMDVLRMFFIESIFIVVTGVIPGLLLSVVFTPSIIQGVFPAITGGFSDLTKGLDLSIEPLAMIVSFGAMLITGSLLGTFPVLTSVNTQPIETIKEN